jgi:arylformamidase
MRFYDISVPIREKMPTWPGDPGVRVTLAQAMERGDPCNVTSLAMGAHTGTHFDAPFHFSPSGKTVDQLDPEVCLGACRVFEIDADDAIDVMHLRGLPIKGVARALFKTSNSRFWATRDEFFEDFVHLTPMAAKFLVQMGVRLVGVDYLSVEGYHAQGAPAHLALLGAGVVILEGLNLADVPPGDYELIALPLKIAGADGAPARAFLRAGPADRS